MIVRKPVVDGFFNYTTGREGFTPFMYCDTLNLVTTGNGNLIDSSARDSFDTSDHAMAPALGLQWFAKGAGWGSRNPTTGARLSDSEVRAAWIATKLQEQNNPGFNKKGGFAYAGLTNATLSMDGIMALFQRQFSDNDATLLKHYPNLAEWPADAQLAVHSMAWAMGASFFPALGFDKFKRAVDNLDFATAAIEGQFKGGGSRTDPKSRNFAHEVMFNNAANVMKEGASRDLLFFPGTSVSRPNVILPNVSAQTAAKVKTAATVVGGIAGVVAIAWGALEWRNRK